MADQPTTSPTQRPSVDYADGIVTTRDGRWEVGAPGDVAALGDWDCDGDATIALLRPAISRVFVFDAWAEHNADLVANELEGVPGARWIEATDVDGDGCDEIVVHTDNGDSVTLSPLDRA